MKYFFIHIPKTSGTTFMEVLRSDKKNQVGFFYQQPGDMDDFEKRIKEGPYYNLERTPDWHKFNFIGGHFTFGIHEILKGEPFKYIGVVREPVAHCISAYGAFLRTSDAYKDYLLPEEKTIENYLHLKFLHNMQTFFLSGLSIEEIRKDKIKAYETVIENSEKYFTGIYPTEKFDAGLFFFKHKIGVKPLYYHKKNVTKKTHRELSNTLLEKIKAVNDVDVKVYDYFHKKFTNELEEIPFINWKVNYFKAMNAILALRTQQQ